MQFVAIFWFLGRPRLYWVMPGETGVTFKDYKGNPEVLEAAKRIVSLLCGVFIPLDGCFKIFGCSFPQTISIG